MSARAHLWPLLVLAACAPASKNPDTASSNEPSPSSACKRVKGSPERPCDPCSARGDAGPREVVIQYEAGSFLAGAARLDVDVRGHAVWTFQPPDPKAPVQRAEADLTPAEIESFATTLSEHRFCATPPSARFGIPDESAPLLAVCRGDQRCEIALWDGEWNERPDAKASLDALDALVAIVRKRSPP